MQGSSLLAQDLCGLHDCIQQQAERMYFCLLSRCYWCLTCTGRGHGLFYCIIMVLSWRRRMRVVFACCCVSIWRGVYTTPSGKLRARCRRSLNRRLCLAAPPIRGVVRRFAEPRSQGLQLTETSCSRYELDLGKPGQHFCAQWHT